MKAFITRAILVLSLALAAIGMSGCVIHAHHTDGNEPTKTHKKKKKKTHKAKPPKAKKEAKPVTEAKPAGTSDGRHDPPPPPAPSR